MNRKIYKSILVFLSVMLILGSAPIIQSNFSTASEGIVFVAEAAGKMYLKKKKLTLKAGKTFNQKLINEYGKNIAASKVRWKSNDKNIATVSKKGKITARKNGKVKMSAIYKGKKYNFTVIVKADRKQPGYSSGNNIGDPDNDDTNGKIVYRTPTGSKYHLDPQCGGKNSMQVDISRAQSSGLTPCKKCAS